MKAGTENASAVAPVRLPAWEPCLRVVVVGCILVAVSVSDETIKFISRGSNAGDNAGMLRVFEISASVSVLAKLWVTDLRVFSPEESDPASGPAMEELIPGSMRPGEARPESPSPPPVCGVPSILEVCTCCPWSNVLGGTLRLRKRYAFGSMVYGNESVSYTHLTLPTNREV